MASVSLTGKLKTAIIEHLHRLLVRQEVLHDTTFPCSAQEIYDDIIPHDVRNALDTIKHYNEELIVANNHLQFYCRWEDYELMMALGTRKEFPGNSTIEYLISKHQTVPPLDATTVAANRIKEWAVRRGGIAHLNAKIRRRIKIVMEFVKNTNQLFYLWPELMELMPAEVAERLTDRKIVKSKIPAGLIGEYDGKYTTLEEFYRGHDQMSDWLLACTLIDSRPVIPLHKGITEIKQYTAQVIKQ